MSSPYLYHCNHDFKDSTLFDMQKPANKGLTKRQKFLLLYIQCSAKVFPLSTTLC